MCVLSVKANKVSRPALDPDGEVLTGRIAAR